MGLVWQFLFFPEITMCAFIVIGSSTKFCRGSTIVLLSANPTLYQIYHHLRITLNFFLYLINLVLMYTFKSTCIFHVYNWQGGLFPPHGSHLPTSVISARAALTKCEFKFLLFLKPINGTSENTFLWSSLQARITSNSFSWGFRCPDTGYYVTINVSLLSFPWIFSITNNSFLGIFLAQSIYFSTNIELHPLFRRNLSKSL